MRENTQARDIRARIRVSDIAKSYVRLQGKSNDLKGLCPFHQEKTPSFTIDDNKGFYHCFGCGAHGDVIDFVMEIENIDFKAALSRLSNDEQLPKRRPVALQPTPDPRDAVKKRKKAFGIWSEGVPIEGTLANKYLNGRGIKTATLKGLKVLRFHPSLDYWDAKNGKTQLIGRFPALLVALQFSDSKFGGVQCIYLNPDGRGKLKLYGDEGRELTSKKIRGISGGAAIRLCPPAEKMWVAEGLENALTALQSGKPCWASAGLHNMVGQQLGHLKGIAHPEDERKRLPSIVPDLHRPAFNPPKECNELIFIGDGDTKDLHMLDALLHRGVARMKRNGLQSSYIKTPRGLDLNDMLMRKGAAPHE